MLKRLCLLVVVSLFLVVPRAWAACVGQDMLPELRAEDAAGLDAMFARAHALLNAQGRFWIVERAGIAPSYLFGTFHTAEAVESVPNAAWQALDRARIAVFELSNEEQSALQERTATDPAFSMDLSAPPLLGKLTDRQRNILERAFEARGMPVEASNQLRPWILATLLGYPACHLRAAAEGEDVLDQVMADRAIGRGIAAVGLETYEDALAGFGGISREQLVDVLLADEELLRREEDIFRTNALLYAAGETAAINELSIWVAERRNPGFDVRAVNEALMDGLLIGRNRAWMPRLIGHVDAGNAFIAVGALHLPGETGLIELLRAEGYTLRRLD